MKNYSINRLIRRRGKLPGVRLWYHAERIGSTQDAARRLAEEGVPSGTLVTAEVQTRGRGRMQRHWSSPRGGIYLTWILRPQVDPNRLAELSLRTAKAIARALARTGVETTVRRPNDVLAARRACFDAPLTPMQHRGAPASTDKSRFQKVAGILPEASTQGGRTQWLLLGIGINANNRMAPHLGGGHLTQDFAWRPN